jgi:hypothetical protein
VPRPFSRTGTIGHFFFIAQWFPKLGVLQDDGWNCHQFHSSTEFFADYGVYDVSLTLPQGFVVGATGTLQDRHPNADGTETLRFIEKDVHDFAWTAGRRYRERTTRFDEPGFPPVQIRLLVQPEKQHLTERYIEATKIALRRYGAWAVPYPYGHVTVVDPAWGSAAGGMEYPTLFTGGGSMWAPRALQSPERVTIHECGHQFWYGLVGNNEFEEAWLDEGFNSYHEEKAAQLALGPRGWGKRYFGLVGPTGTVRGGWPVVAPGVWIGRGEEELSSLRRNGQVDVMARPGWLYRTARSYGINSYGKPALSLQTLEGLVGDDTMTRIMRTFARRYTYGHPTSADFIAVVNEVTGQDYRWFFDQTWFSSDLCDYAVSVRNRRQRHPEGFVEGPGGTLTLVRPRVAPDEPHDEDDGVADGGEDHGATYDGEVTVQRLGGVRMPVEVLVELADGRRVTETWDGQYRWTRFRYPGTRVTHVVVDPEGKIALDVDPSNNSWTDERGIARRAARKWAARWMLWLQDLLELHTVLL